ncbi:MAG: hypothetical protein V2A69_08410 [Pseudomonadota bacterium]
MEEMAKRGDKEILPSENFMNELTERQRRGLLRLARLEEIPETQVELARGMGITERALYTWWNEARWCKAVLELIGRSRIKHLPAIENSLIKRAKEGSYLHQKGFYRLIGEDLEGKSVTQTNVQINLFTPEQQEIIRRMASEIADRD